jgi:hypothetical protein
MQNRQIISTFVAAFLMVTTIAPVSRAKDEKIKPEELVSKHLASIGPAEKLKAIKSRTTQGTVQVVFRVGGSGTLNGKANILSQGNLIRSGFIFPAIEYPGEQLAFDGNKVTAMQTSPGNYPPMSSFLYENDSLMKEGLLFGSLTTAWALLDTGTRKPRLDVTGVKKIDGKQLIEMKYNGKSWKNGMTAFLYFDPETYRHVRSQFKIEVPTSKVTTITDSAELVRYQIVERFDQFGEFDGITLPKSHQIEFTVDSPRGGIVTTFAHVVDRVVHDEALEAPLFSVK